jgi:hypothetical protein
MPGGAFSVCAIAGCVSTTLHQTETTKQETRTELEFMTKPGSREVFGAFTYT